VCFLPEFAWNKSRGTHGQRLHSRDKVTLLFLPITRTSLAQIVLSITTLTPHHKEFPSHLRRVQSYCMYEVYDCVVNMDFVLYVVRTIHSVAPTSFKPASSSHFHQNAFDENAGATAVVGRGRTVRAKQMLGQQKISPHLLSRLRTHNFRTSWLLFGFHLTSQFINPSSPTNTMNSSPAFLKPAKSVMARTTSSRSLTSSALHETKGRPLMAKTPSSEMEASSSLLSAEFQRSVSIEEEGWGQYVDVDPTAEVGNRVFLRLKQARVSIQGQRSSLMGWSSVPL
jgi:hypothetical protein